MEPKSRRRSGNQPVKQTVFIPPKVHRRLKELCFANDWSQQQIFMAALDSWLIGQGEPGIAELEGETKDE